MPVNLKKKNLALFSHELERVIPETHLLEFQGIRISSEGILFKGVKIRPESFAFPFLLKEWKRRSVVRFLLNNYLFRGRRVFDADALWIVDQWSYGYFHWLTDALTRLYVVRDRLDELVLVLPRTFQTQDFVNSSLKVFAVNAVEFIGQREVLECRRLLMPTHTAPSGHYREEIIRGVRKLLLSAYGANPNPQSGERVYISRSRASKRRIRNEKELEPVLGKFGFQIIHPEECSFDEQVRIFSRARYLVSNHGAGLTNMLFMRQGGSVLELRHHEDRINNCYFTLASALDLRYFYQTCRPDIKDADPHTADLLVNSETLAENLRLLVET